MSERFVTVLVDEWAERDESVCLRFKCAGTPSPIREVIYEAEDGTSGWWTVMDAASQAQPVVVPVEDSSEGTVLLVYGGNLGLRIVHHASQTSRFEPYLLLSSTTSWRGP